MGREFSLAEILNITTGVVLTSFEDIQDFLGYLTGEELYTHQYTRVGTLAQEYLCTLFPALDLVDCPTQEWIEANWRDQESEEYRAAKVNVWVTEQAKIVGFESAVIEPFDSLEYESVDPLQELLDILGSTDDRFSLVGM